MSIKITSFEIENVKRIKMLQYTPTENGLTVIGGKNNQGKTTVLDSIAWALGGDQFRPTNAARDGALTNPYLKVTLSNGIVVERKGKNSSLKVTDPSGRLAGQSLLNSFVEQFALDVPKFLNSNSKEKASILLRIIGVGDKLFTLERDEGETYAKRHAVGQIADQKKKFAKEMPLFQDVPDEPVSVSQLISEQQEILARNGENQRKRDRAYDLELRRNELAERINRTREQLDKMTAELADLEKEVETAYKTAEELHDESTAELEENLRSIEEINRKVRANLDREKAEADAEEYARMYDDLTEKLSAIRQQKKDLLEGADLPLPGLSVENGELTYQGRNWDCLSSSQQLKIATAIVRKLNPECGFVLLDKLEQMDNDTLSDFAAWLENENLQAIATRVSTGDECSVIIEDGKPAVTKRPEIKKDWSEF